MPRRKMTRESTKPLVANPADRAKTAEGESTLVSSAALHAWGIIAILSAVVAIGSFFLIPDGNERPGSDILVQNSGTVGSSSKLHETDSVAGLDTGNSSQTPAIDWTITSTASPDQETESSRMIRRDAFPLDEPAGAEIGISHNSDDLVTRFRMLSKRAPGIFNLIEPRIVIENTAAGRQAKLIAGPFDTIDELAEFCRAVKLRLTVECNRSAYSGQAFAR